jgi:hypothetical protein
MKREQDTEKLLLKIQEGDIKKDIIQNVKKEMVQKTKTIIKDFNTKKAEILFNYE